MAGSLRRKKRHQIKIVKRKAKKRFTKSKVPALISEGRPEIKLKFGREVAWDESKKIDANYEATGFVAEAKPAFGRNRTHSDPLEQAEGGKAAVELDDDLKAAMGQVRSSGKAPPKRLTPNQRQIVERLLAAHGDDVEAMVMDRRLNPMQHSTGALEKLIASYRHWKIGSGVDFRVPTKRLW